MQSCVITTINKPTETVIALSKHLTVYVVGDKKTPAGWKEAGVNFISVKDQEKLACASIKHTPYNHYVRKNIGYLYAISGGATMIYDTDDDNVPNKHWHKRQVDCVAEVYRAKGWCNVYKFFHKANIWPRGLHLPKVQDDVSDTLGNVKLHSPIQQGLADGNPDVDAIWRLTTSEKITFKKKRSVYLASGSWCPFNSQSTWWWPEAFPLLYLPIHATFRMTDIWRSFVAQRCLWAMGYGVTFHSPSEVYQERNPHDLLRDFEDEVPGYLNNGKIAEKLDAVGLKFGSDSATTMDNLLACYAALVDGNFLPKQELVSVRAWIRDLKNIV